jgi:hypothetical protein
LPRRRRHEHHAQDAVAFIERPHDCRRDGWHCPSLRLECHPAAGVYVLVSLASAAFPGILVYLILWLLMPNEAD